MRTFKEFVESNNKEAKEKLKTLKDVLEKQTDMSVESFLSEEDPFLFVKVKTENKILNNIQDINLGIKISSLGKRLIYRLHIGPKGASIGVAKNLYDEEDYVNKLSVNKNEIRSLKEIMEEVPNKLRKFLEKTYSNIKKKANKTPESELTSKDEFISQIIMNLF